MTQQDDITQRLLTDDGLQALWDEACKDSPQAPGWNRHLRYGRAIETALLSKLRAPVSSIREGFELTYAADADDPACASDLSHFTNGWRACVMSQVRAPVAELRLEWSAKALYDAIKDVLLNHRLSNLVDEDGEFFPLVDHLCSQDDKTTESGEFEIALICDAIYNDVLTKSAPVADERLSDATLAALVNKHGLHALPIMQVFEFAKDVCAALASAPVAVPVSPDLQAQIVALRRPDWPSTGDRSSFHEGYETARVDILRLLRRSAPVAREAQPVAWFTDDHLIDKSATTWDRTVAERWRAKGWSVRPLVYGDAAPQASAEDVRNAALEEAAALCESWMMAKTATHLQDMANQTMRRMADYIRALKQPQADKDGGQWEPLTPEQIAADMRNMARSEGFDWPEPASAEVQPNAEIVALAREGVRVNKPGTPEYQICAELRRLARALKRPRAGQGERDA